MMAGGKFCSSCDGAGCRMSILVMNVLGAVRRHFRAVLLSAAGHRWPVGAWLLVQAGRVSVVAVAYLLADWLLVEVEAV